MKAIRNNMLVVSLLAVAGSASAQVDPDWCRYMFSRSSAANTCVITDVKVSSGLCHMTIPCQDGKGGSHLNNGSFRADLLPHYCNVDGVLTLQAQSCRALP